MVRHQTRWGAFKALGLMLWAVMLAPVVQAQRADEAQPQPQPQAEAGSTAKGRPLWEAGVGLALVSLPDYRGSDESRQYALPLPYLIYRGKIFKADREGARAQLLKHERVHVDINVGASVPVASRRNQARAGMPNLAGSFEVGPALDVLAYQSEAQDLKVRLRLPVSYGLTLGKPIGGNGWQAAPHINLDIRNLMGVQGLGLGMLTGPLYATRARHAYFYDVDAAYATASRPAYQASGGYAGAQFVAALSKRFDGFWAGAFVRYDNLNGAVFASSPLVKTRHYVAGGLGIAWVLGQSGELVRPD